MILSVGLASPRCCWSTAMIPMELDSLWSQADSYQVLLTALVTCRSKASFRVNPPHERQRVSGGGCSFGSSDRDCFATGEVQGQLLTLTCTAWADPGQTHFTSLKLWQMLLALEFIHALQKGHIQALDKRLLVQLLQFQNITPSWWLMWFFPMLCRWGEMGRKRRNTQQAPLFKAVP